MSALGLILTLSASPSAAAEKAPPGTIEAVQVGVGPCVTQSTEFAFAPILSAVLSTAISQGVNKLGAAFKAAGAEKTWKANGSRNVDIKAEEFKGCVQVVRGHFYTSPPSRQEKPDGLDSRVSWDGLARNGLYLASAPDFFFEGHLSKARTATGAITISPLYAVMRKPIGTKTLRPGKERHVALFITFFTPGEAALVTPDNAAASIVLGKMVPGVALDYVNRPAAAQQSEPETDPFGEDADAGTPLKPLEWVRPPAEAPWFKLALDKDAQPLTMGVLLTQTQGANGFVKFLGEVFGSEAVTGAVTTELKNEIVPADRKTAKAAAATEAATLVSDYETAVVTALDKTLACSTGTPTGTAANEARTALRTLNQKAQARAYDKLPVTDEQILAIRPVDGASSINAACLSARNAVVAYATARP